MKVVLIGYVMITCRIQNMSDMIRKYRSYKNFTEININNNKKVTPFYTQYS